MRISRLKCIALFLLTPVLLFAASQGPYSPSSYSSDANWSSQTQAYSQNDAYAICNQSFKGDKRLILKGYGFSIPSNAIIDSILVEVDSYKTGRCSYFTRLAKDGISEIGNGAAQLSDAGDEDNYIIDDNLPLWGTTWAPIQINSANFATILYTDDDCSSNNWYVDHVRVIVYYSMPSNAQKRRIKIDSEE